MTVVAVVTAMVPIPAHDQTTEYEIVPGVRIGPITSKTTERDLVRRYGRSQVKRQQVSTNDEGGQRLGTVLFPGTADEIEIIWRSSSFTRPTSVLIRRSGGKWKTVEGVRVGMSLGELEQVNGGEFELAGFAWDGAGTITSWRGGRLDRTCPQNLVRLRLDAHGFENLPMHEQELLMGSERRLRSFDPLLSKLQLVVGEVRVLIR